MSFHKNPPSQYEYVYVYVKLQSPKMYLLSLPESQSFTSRLQNNIFNAPISVKTLFGADAIVFLLGGGRELNEGTQSTQKKTRRFSQHY